MEGQNSEIPLEKLGINNHTKVDPKIINISERILSKEEIEILEKGFKFTPTPNSDNLSLEKDIDEFCRKLRLREFFGREENSDDSIVRNKKGTTIQRGRNKDLDDYIDVLKSTKLSPYNKNTVKNNLNGTQKKALQDLQNDPEIILKEADKGGAIVCMSKSFYKSLVLQHLEDKNFYEKLPENPDKNIFRNLKQLCRKYRHLLQEKEFDYLTNFEMRTSNFYGLPKIHKSNSIKTAIEEQNQTYISTGEPTDLKLRPIVAGPACPTHRLSNFIDILLKDLCQRVPSYIRDSLDFLNKIPEIVHPNTLLVTFDVTSLYTQRR